MESKQIMQINGGKLTRDFWGGADKVVHRGPCVKDKYVHRECGTNRIVYCEFF